MVDYKKHKRRKFLQKKGEDIIFIGIGKGYIDKHMDVNGNIYYELTQKGLESMSYEGEQLREVFKIGFIKYGNKLPLKKDINFLERKDKN